MCHLPSDPRALHWGHRSDESMARLHVGWAPCATDRCLRSAPPFRPASTVLAPGSRLLDPRYDLLRKAAGGFGENIRWGVTAVTNDHKVVQAKIHKGAKPLGHLLGASDDTKAVNKFIAHGHRMPCGAGSMFADLIRTG